MMLRASLTLLSSLLLAGVTTKATDDAIQANIVAVGYKTLPPVFIPTSSPASSSATAAPSAQNPNIIHIMGDDVGRDK